MRPAGARVQIDCSLTGANHSKLHRPAAFLYRKAWADPAFCREKLGLPGALGTIDRSKLNVKGGSLAIGHPFAATGARIVATLAKILDEAKGKRGLISVCTAGGMGVTAILER